ncbi:MAG: circularly permuted type 2 ATP-grasp protein [Candidatus Dadabacteria bacterium]|nr:circularly permuted type 2 ATP-grasp protein [Candidatus Dadabacteria bacterium]
MHFKNYDTEGFYDEVFKDDGTPYDWTRFLTDKIDSLSDGELLERQQAAEMNLFEMGVTFTLYSEEEQGSEENIFPFDIIPRLISAQDWELIERGLKQRIHALNLFIDDIYNDRKILRDKIVPKDLILSSKGFRLDCVGFSPPRKIWCHITGTDIIRHSDGKFYILEDNLRSPSGVSYVLENRELMKRTFPKVFGALKIMPISDYGLHLLDTLQYLLSDRTADPKVVLLTPGIYNSAYFEHSFLAKEMGIELVEGRDLIVVDNFVHLKTTKGLEKVDVIYRRVDDDFLDPQVFRPDSVLGVPGLFSAYKAGNVAIANAPGGGVADDKIIYAYVEKIIKYYLGEDPVISNVPTYICEEDEARKYVLDNIEKLVVKPANESGGYGIVFGPKATKEELAQAKRDIIANPRNYIAQKTMALSRAPVIAGDHFEGRHVDLRPFILCGKDVFVLPGGLTRVALRKGSMIVNSSQGGGSKDTWVLAPAKNSNNRGSKKS